jgi:predicted PurR-regulated permease PerM
LAALDNEVRPSQVTLKTVFTVAFGVLVVVAIVEAIANAMLAVSLTGAALLLAVALDHPVRMLERRGIKRPLAIAIVLLAGLGLMVAFGFTLIPPAVDQGKALVHDAPQFVRGLRGSALFRTIDSRFHLGDHLMNAERRLPQMLEGAATPILNALSDLLSGIAAAVTIAFLIIFMLVFGPRLIDAAVAETRAERRGMYQDVLGKIYQSIGGYLGGLALICTINATLATSFLAIDRVPFFLPLGIVAGLSSMIPYAGPIVAGTGITLIALLTQGLWHGVASAIYFLVYGLLEGNLLAPLIFRRTVNVNPLVVMLSILFFGEIAGMMGAIIAVPVVATLQIVLREVLRIRREKLARLRDA